MTPLRTRPRGERLDARDLPSVTFRFDYSLDTTGFFAAPERRAALEQAGFVLTNQLNDSLAAVRPSGANAWTVSLTNPATGQTVTKSDLAINADEIVVYVAPTVLGDTARPSFELPQPLPSLAERVVHRFHDVRSVGADLRLTLRPREIQA